MSRMDIHEIWMRLESMSHLRDMGPKYKGLHDKLAKEVEGVSAEADKEVQAEAKAVKAALESQATNQFRKPTDDQIEARREAGRRSLEATAGRPSVGAQDKADAERTLPIDPVTGEPIEVERRV